MNTLARTFIACVIAVAVFFGSTGIAAAAVVVSAGVVNVKVHESGADGVDLSLPIPAALLDLGLVVAEIAMPAEAKAEVRRELAEVRPLLRELGAAFEDMPDATLVKVTSDDENVTITKRGRMIHIEVLSDNEHVQISVPVRVIGKVANFLA